MRLNVLFGLKYKQPLNTMRTFEWRHEAWMADNCLTCFQRPVEKTHPSKKCARLLHQVGFNLLPSFFPEQNIAVVLSNLIFPEVAHHLFYFRDGSSVFSRTVRSWWSLWNSAVAKAFPSCITAKAEMRIFKLALNFTVCWKVKLLFGRLQQESMWIEPSQPCNRLAKLKLHLLLRRRIYMQ